MEFIQRSLAKFSTLIFFIALTLQSIGQVDFEKITGVNYVSPQTESGFTKMANVKRIHADWVSLTPFTFLSYDSPSFAFDATKNWMGDSVEGVENLMIEAREHEFKVMLKPHFIMEDLKWVGDFSLKEKDLLIWEDNYLAYILTLAELAEKYDIEMLCIGTEFKYSVNNRADFWEELIEEVRAVYTGSLTYAANWDNYYNITFWDDLDFIGIDAYFPISNKSNPEAEELEKKWVTVARRLNKFSYLNDRQIIFTEYGYRSTDNACGKQWLIESVPSSEKINLEAQKLGYQALYEAVWEEDWFAGGFVWRWWPNDAKAGGAQHSNYTPQNKPAEEVIRQFYRN